MDSTEYVLSIIYKGSILSVSISDDKGCLVAIASREFTLSHETRATLDPDELLSGVILLLDKVLRKAHIMAQQILGIGVSAPDNAMVVWDVTSGSPLGSVEFLDVSQHLQRDQASFIAELIEARKGAAISRSGSPVIYVGGIESWLIWNLSQGAHHVIASSHHLVSVYRLMKEEHFSPGPRDRFPVFAQPVGCDSQIGRVATPYLSNVPVPITSVTTNAVSALFGAGIVDEHEAFISYDREGLFVALSAWDASHASVEHLRSLRLAASNTTIFEHLISTSFTAPQMVLEWLQTSLFGVYKNDDLSEIVDTYLRDETLVIEMSASSPDRATIHGIGPATKLETIYAAAYRAMATAVTMAIEDVVRQSGHSIYRLYTDSNGFGNAPLYRLQSQMTKLPLCVRNEDVVRLGSAFLTGVGANGWDRDKIFEWLTQNVQSHVYDSGVLLDSGDR